LCDARWNQPFAHGTSSYNILRRGNTGSVCRLAANYERIKTGASRLSLARVILLRGNLQLADAILAARRPQMLGGFLNALLVTGGAASSAQTRWTNSLPGHSVVVLDDLSSARKIIWQKSATRSPSSREASRT